MGTRINENNKLSLTGTIATGFEYSHEIFGEGFYITYISVMRLSQNEDLIPVMVSERLVDVTKDLTGRLVSVDGTYRSYNHFSDERTHLVLTAFAKEFEILDDNVFYESNNIYLNGTLCKPPVYRKTPFGREIADLMIAVNRPYGKSDYIPCVCWGRNARFASGLEVGSRIQLWGRIQSREYTKTKDGESEVRTAYEVSVNKIEVV